MIDNAVSLDFDLTNNKKPYYGYASVVADGITKGQVIVQGSLSIAYRGDHNPLMKLIKTYEDFSEPEKYFDKITELVNNSSAPMYPKVTTRSHLPMSGSGEFVFTASELTVDKIAQCALAAKKESLGKQTTYLTDKECDEAATEAFNVIKNFEF